MATYDYIIKQGATKPPVEVGLTDTDGDPLDLTGAAVKFVMSEVGGDTRHVDADATIVDESTGDVSYEWSDGDTDDVGDYNGEFHVDDDGGATFEADRKLPRDDYIDIRIEEGL